MLTLQSLRLFVRVVKDASFSGAGRSVGLSAASVSRSINDLEEYLGVRLLNRSSRKLSLTEAGTTYYQRVEAILGDLQDANEQLTILGSEPRGTLRVHARTGIGTLIVGPALPKFLKQYPDLRVEFITSNNDTIDIIDLNIDVDIRIGKLKDSTFIGKLLAPSDRIVVGSEAYFYEYEIPTHPDDLVKHNCIYYSSGASKPVWRYRDKNGAIGEVKINGNFSTDNGLVLIDSAVQGVGLILIAHLDVLEHLNSGRLIRVLQNYDITRAEFEFGVYAVYQKRRHLSGKLDAFITFLTELFRDLH